VGYDIGLRQQSRPRGHARLRASRSIQRIMDEVEHHQLRRRPQNNETRGTRALRKRRWKAQAASPLKEMARQQLGTVGSGNHTWTFSPAARPCLDRRSLRLARPRHKLATWFLEKGGAKDGNGRRALLIPASTDLGDNTSSCMNLAGEMPTPAANGLSACRKNSWGGNSEEVQTKSQIFAWRESHGGEDYWVVRKGATPAFPGQKRFRRRGTNGRNGASSSKGSKTKPQNNRSTAPCHGAGRVMAAWKPKAKNSKTVPFFVPAKSHKKLMREWG